MLSKAVNKSGPVSVPPVGQRHVPPPMAPAAGHRQDAAFQALFQGMYDAAFLVMGDGRVLDANLRASMMLGYQREDLRRMNLCEIVIGLDASVIATVARNLAEDRFTLLQAMCLAADESLIATEISISHLPLPATDCLCFFVRDITARKEAEEAIQQANEDLAREAAENEKSNAALRSEISERLRVEQELNKAIEQLKEHDREKSEFVSNVSHELKTPLASIKYTTDNMLNGVTGVLPQGAVAYLEMIREDCLRLKRTVEDILDMSRAESGTLKLATGTLMFGRFLQKATDSLIVQAEAENLTMTYVGNGVNCFVCGDPQRLERVLFNVVKNAIKFNVPHGTIDIELAEMDGDPKQALVRVIDSGIGIPQEHLGNISKRFYRVGEHVSGSGLGLAISREILLRHGGGMSVDSPPPGRERGTVVSFWLPQTTPPHIGILAGEERPVSRLMDSCLHGRGYRTTLLPGVADVQALEPGARPDVLVVDWIGPGMGGAVLLACLTQCEELASIPIVVVADKRNEPVKQEILDGIAHPVLKYPFTEDELLDGMEQALGVRMAKF